VPGTTLATLERGFAEARRFGGDFCLATHYWELDTDLRSVMRGFLDFVSRQADARLVAVEELFS
jgi:hypothetical protein